MNRMQRSKILGPMLYIQQPTMILPTIKMQERFRSKGDSILNAESERSIEKAEIEEIDTTGQVEKVAIEVKNLTEEITEEINEEILVEVLPSIDDIPINNERPILNSAYEDSIVYEREEEQQRKRKGFNDFSIDEKFLFLKKVPVSVARIRYKFITADHVYIGYFIKSKGDSILITHRNRTVEVLNESLLDIKIIGL